MFTRVTGLLGSLGLIASIFLPLTYYKDPTISAYGFQPAALWEFSIILAVLLFLASSANIFFLYKFDLDNIKKSSYAIAGVVGLTLCILCANIIWSEDVRWQGGFLSTITSMLMVSSETLFVSTLFCLSAPLLPSYMVSWAASAKQKSETVAASRPVIDPSLPRDAGRCANCGQVNSKAAKNCHNCGAILPWAIPRDAQQKTPTAKGANATFDLATWLKTASVNVLTFLFCLGAPFLGYFLWKYLEKEDSPQAPVAIIASILGIVFYVGRFAWSFIKIGSTISQ